MTLDILTAMLTPVVLISACASLLISTSSRLSRVVDETRSFSDRIETMMSTPQSSTEDAYHQRQRVLLLHQLPFMTRRARLLQIGLVILYAAVAVFVATSVALGVIAGLHINNLWSAVGLGFLGMMLLLGSSTCLTLEARLALHTTAYEMRWLRDMLLHENIPATDTVLQARENIPQATRDVTM